MIKQAAILDKNGKIWTLPRPNRHGDIITLFEVFSTCIMGFIDENGKFYNRVEAWEHAIESRQDFYTYNPINPNDRFITDVDLNRQSGLVSEDLW